MKYIVYLTINTENNKIYIGVHKTENPDIFDGYIGCGVIINNPSSYSNPETPFQYAVKKYGASSFRRFTLKVFDNIEDALELEKDLVTPSFLKREDVYNVTIGGNLGNYYFPVNQFDLKGNFLKTWDNAQLAADFYHISSTAIYNAMKFKGSCNKYYWSKDDKIDISEYTLSEGTQCYSYDENGKFIEGYNSIPEAAALNNVPTQSVQRAIKGGYQVDGKYYSTKILDEFIKVPKISLKNRSIYIYKLNGEYVTTLNSTKEITEFFNIKSTSDVTTAIRTKRQYKDYQISLEYVDKMEPIKDKRNKTKKVIQYTLEGEFIQEFDSVTKAVGIYGTGVQRVLKGQQKQCKGFIFKFK